MAADPLKLLEQNETLNSEKSQWNTHWQLVTEFVCQRKASFTTFQEPGSFLNSEIWSDVAPLAAETCASALVGLIWPDSYSFALEPFGDLKEDEETKKWFIAATKDLQAAMDDPEAGLALAMDEFLLDYVVLGTPAIHVEEGDKTDLRFDAWNVSQFSIDEGADSYVDTFFKCYSYTVRQAVNKFGLENLSKSTQEAYKGRRYLEKIKVLHVIQPREVSPNGGKGSKNMPYASVYIEVDQKKIIRESGFQELPTFAARYSKKIGEKYGRSPAMRALPSIQELNALWELVTIGAEKNYDPPLAVYDDGAFGGGTIDTSAGAINVINVSGKLNGSRQPIQPLFTVGSFQDVAVLIERLENTIKDHFMIDRLLDLNNEKEMTAREALIRQMIRQSTLRSPIGRLVCELLNRMIPRCFNILLRKGRFGYVAGSPEALAWQAANPGQEMRTIPEKVANAQGSGKRVYQIRYLNPAAREQEAQEAQGIMDVYGLAAEILPIDGTIKDLINNERAIKKFGQVRGAPDEMWNTKAEVKALNDASIEAQTKAAEMNDAAAVAGIAKDMGAAMKGMPKGAAAT